MAIATLTYNEAVVETIEESISTKNIHSCMTSEYIGDNFIGGNKFSIITRYDLLNGAYPPQFTITDLEPKGIRITSVEMLVPDINTNEYIYIQSLFNEEYPIYPGDTFEINEFSNITKLNPNDNSDIIKGPIRYSIEDMTINVPLDQTASNVYRILFRYIYDIENDILGDKQHYIYFYLNNENPTSNIPYPSPVYINQFKTNVKPNSITEIGNSLIKNSIWKYHIDGFLNIGKFPVDEQAITIPQPTIEIEKIRFNSAGSQIYPEFDTPFQNDDLFNKIYFFRSNFQNIYPDGDDPQVIDVRLTYFGKPVIEGQAIPYRSIKEGRLLFDTTYDDDNLPVLFIGFDLLSGGAIKLYETELII